MNNFFIARKRKKKTKKSKSNPRRHESIVSLKTKHQHIIWMRKCCAKSRRHYRLLCVECDKFFSDNISFSINHWVIQIPYTIINYNQLVTHFKCIRKQPTGSNARHISTHTHTYTEYKWAQQIFALPKQGAAKPTLFLHPSFHFNNIRKLWNVVGRKRSRWTRKPIHEPK